LYPVAVLDDHVRQQVLAGSNLNGDLGRSHELAEALHDQHHQLTLKEAMHPSGHRFLPKNTVSVLAAGLVGGA
jgi:hypothetical protein